MISLALHLPAKNSFMNMLIQCFLQKTSQTMYLPKKTAEHFCPAVSHLLKRS